MRLPVQIEIIIFRKVQDTFEFLLLKRTSDRGGFWQPITGGLESTDVSKKEACLRELFEETRITSKNIVRILEEFHSFVFESEGLVKKEYCFGVEVSENTSVSISHNIYPKHTEYRWVSIDEALSLLKWDNNKTALKMLNSKLL